VPKVQAGRKEVKAQPEQIAQWQARKAHRALRVPKALREVELRGHRALREVRALPEVRIRFSNVRCRMKGQT
jgi:hypothetical protein